MTQPMTYAAGLRARLARPGNALTRLNLLTRRIMVGLSVAGAVVAAAAPWSFGAADTSAVLSGAAFVVMLLTGALLDLSTRTIHALPASALDERSRERRDHASHVAMRFLVTPLVCVASMALVLGRSALSGLSDLQFMLAVVVVAIAVTFTPVWVLAWTEPTVVVDEDDDPAGPSAPSGPFPWWRLLGIGAYFAGVMAVLRLLGWWGEPEPLGSALVAALVAGLLFATLMGVTTAVTRRRL